MYFKTTLWAAALCAGSAMADFMVYTELPIPRDAIPTFANSETALAWTSSVLLNARIAYGAYTRGLGEPYQSSRSSAASEIQAFVSTASNFSIPAAVTDDGTTTTFSSKPDWYTALPTRAREFKERQVSDQYDVVRSVINDDNPSATAGGASAGGSSTGAGVMPTPRAGLGAGFGAMAAVAAGVFL